MNLPRWAAPGGQMHEDPLIQRVLSFIEEVSQWTFFITGSLPPDELLEQYFWEAITGTHVPFVSSQEERDVVSSAGEVEEVLYGLYLEQQHEDRPRTDFPEWEDPFRETWTEIRLEDRCPWPENPVDWDYRQVVPSTDRSQELAESSWDRLVLDAWRARKAGKRWGSEPAFLLGAYLAFREGQMYEEQRRRGFAAYHATYAPNCTAMKDGLRVRTGRHNDLLVDLSWEVVKEIFRVLPKRTQYDLVAKASRVDRGLAIALAGHASPGQVFKV